MTTPAFIALRAALAEEAGAFAAGYTSEQVDATLGALSDASGLRLVAVWEYVDWCTGGSSMLAVEGSDGSLTDISDALWRHLTGEAEPEVIAELIDIVGVDALTSMRTWVSDISGSTHTRDLVPVTGHNYAAERR